MASLKGEKGAAAGYSPKADAAGPDAARVRQQVITTVVPVGTSAVFAEAATQVLPTAGPSQLRAGANEASGKAGVRRDRRPAEPPRRYTPGHRTTMISRLVLLA